MVATTTTLFDRIPDFAGRRDEYRIHATFLRVKINAGPVSRGEDCDEK
jgi:hypothetical protein